MCVYFFYIEEMLAELNAENVQEINERMQGYLNDAKNVSEELFRSMDVDGDGKITKAEFLTGYVKASADAFGQFTMPV